MLYCIYECTASCYVCDVSFQLCEIKRTWYMCWLTNQQQTERARKLFRHHIQQKLTNSLLWYKTPFILIMLPGQKKNSLLLFRFNRSCCFFSFPLNGTFRLPWGIFHADNPGWRFIIISFTCIRSSATARTLHQACLEIKKKNYLA